MTLKVSSTGHIRHFLLPSVVTESSHGTICLAVRSGGITSTKHEAIYNRKWKKSEKVLYTSHATLWYRRSRGRWQRDVIDWGASKTVLGNGECPLKQQDTQLDTICPIRSNRTTKPPVNKPAILHSANLQQHISVWPF